MIVTTTSAGDKIGEDDSGDCHGGKNDDDDEGGGGDNDDDDDDDDDDDRDTDGITTGAKVTLMTPMLLSVWNRTTRSKHGEYLSGRCSTVH